MRLTYLYVKLVILFIDLEKWVSHVYQLSRFNLKAWLWPIWFFNYFINVIVEFWRGIFATFIIYLQFEDRKFYYRRFVFFNWFLNFSWNAAYLSFEGSQLVLLCYHVVLVEKIINIIFGSLDRVKLIFCELSSLLLAYPWA
jgi:hypothetical protein